MALNLESYQTKHDKNLNLGKVYGMLLVAKHNLNDIGNVKTHKNLLKSEGMLPSGKA